MSMSLHLSWQGIYLGENQLIDALAKAFLKKELAGYFQSVSLRNKAIYHPLRLTPKNLFHLDLRRRVPAPVVLKGKNYPYTFDHPKLGTISVGSVYHLFLPNILSIRTTVYTPLLVSTNKAFELRNLFSDPLLSTLSGLPRVGGLRRFELKPMIDLFYSTEEGDFVTRERAFAAALLINDVHFNNSANSITERVLDKNADHNAKNIAGRLTLIDKQGLLTIRDRHSIHDAVLEHEIKKKKNLFELGLVLSAFYHQYKSIRQSFPRYLDYLYLSTVPLIRYPDTTFTLSFTNKLAWKLIMQELNLVESFATSLRIDLSEPSPITRFDDRNPEPQYSHLEFWSALENAS